MPGRTTLARLHVACAWLKQSCAFRVLGSRGLGLSALTSEVLGLGVRGFGGGVSGCTLPPTYGFSVSGYRESEGDVDMKTAESNGRDTKGYTIQPTM